MNDYKSHVWGAIQDKIQSEQFNTYIHSAFTYTYFHSHIHTSPKIIYVCKSNMFVYLNKICVFNQRMYVWESIVEMKGRSFLSLWLAGNLQPRHVQNAIIKPWKKCKPCSKGSNHRGFEQHFIILLKRLHLCPLPVISRCTSPNSSVENQTQQLFRQRGDPQMLATGHTDQATRCWSQLPLHGFQI